MIIEQYNQRIDSQMCSKNLKELLRKCLFKITAAESVSNEISFLLELKLNLKNICQEYPNTTEFDDLILLVKEMYQIAIDKQIDQNYHQCSKYIDHLNVHDYYFRMYTLQNIQTNFDLETQFDQVHEVHQDNYNNHQESHQEVGDDQQNRYHQEITGSQSIIQQDSHSYINNLSYQVNQQNQLPPYQPHSIILFQSPIIHRRQTRNIHNTSVTESNTSIQSIHTETMNNNQSLNIISNSFEIQNYNEVYHTTQQQLHIDRLYQNDISNQHNININNISLQRGETFPIRNQNIQSYSEGEREELFRLLQQDDDCRISDIRNRNIHDNNSSEDNKQI